MNIYLTENRKLKTKLIAPICADHAHGDESDNEGGGSQRYALHALAPGYIANEADDVNNEIEGTEKEARIRGSHVPPIVPLTPYIPFLTDHGGCFFSVHAGESMPPLIL